MSYIMCIVYYVLTVYNIITFKYRDIIYPKKLHLKQVI
jgi:hypothetical protein